MFNSKHKENDSSLHNTARKMNECWFLVIFLFSNICLPQQLPELVARYEFDDIPNAASTIVPDSAGNRLDAVRSGGASVSTQIVRNALSTTSMCFIERDNSRVTMPSSFEFPSLGGYVALWAKQNSRNNDFRFFAKAVSIAVNDAYFQVRYSRADDKMTFRLKVMQTGSTTSSTATHMTSFRPPIGSWVHYVFGYNGQFIDAFADGVSIFSTSLIGAYDPTTQARAIIGNQENDDVALDGCVDSVYVLTVRSSTQRMTATMAMMTTTISLLSTAASTTKTTLSTLTKPIDAATTLTKVLTSTSTQYTTSTILTTLSSETLLSSVYTPTLASNSSILQQPIDGVTTSMVPSTTPSEFQYWIIIVVVFALLLFILLAIFIGVAVRRCRFASLSGSNSLYVDESRQLPSTNVAMNTVKDMNAEPSYASTLPFSERNDVISHTTTTCMKRSHEYGPITTTAANLSSSMTYGRAPVIYSTFNALPGYSPTTTVSSERTIQTN